MDCVEPLFDVFACACVLRSVVAAVLNVQHVISTDLRNRSLVLLFFALLGDLAVADSVFLEIDPIKR